MLGDKKTSGRLVRGMAEEEDGNAAIETALLAALAAFFAFTMKALLATPLLNVFSKVSQALNQVLGG
jgi:Flp pilus assembly pilin Flp